MKKAKQQKGITLVALVITIIILIILAGIAIASLTNTGLFGRAQEAKNLTENAQKQEKATLNDYSEAINEAIGEKPKEEESLKNVDKSKTDPESAMPSGVKEVIENDATKGIVIKDSKDNEWVWIEVPKNITADKTEDSDIETALQTYAGGYRSSWTDVYSNGCGMTETEYNAAKSKMLQRIKTNGGFWISRYEAGIDGSNADTSLARTSHKEITDSSLDAVSQANMIPYNYVYCSEAQVLAKRMSTDSTKTSSLLFGIQWDLTCKFLEEKGDWDTTTNTASYYIKSHSESWGNYGNATVTPIKTGAKQLISSTWTASTADKPKNTSILLTTGASDYTKKMNIYDFAGNEYEWTLEKTILTYYPRALRGGGYSFDGSEYTASYRCNYAFTTNIGSFIGFRSALY